MSEDNSFNMIEDDNNNNNNNDDNNNNSGVSRSNRAASSVAEMKADEDLAKELAEHLEESDDEDDVSDNDHSEDINTLKSDLKSAVDEISVIKSAFMFVSQNVDELKTIQADIKILQAAVAGISKRVDKLEAAKPSKSPAVSKLEDDLRKMKSSMAKKSSVDQLLNRIKKLENLANDLKNNQNVIYDSTNNANASTNVVTTPTPIRKSKSRSSSKKKDQKKEKSTDSFVNDNKNRSPKPVKTPTTTRNIRAQSAITRSEPPKAKISKIASKTSNTPNVSKSRSLPRVAQIQHSKSEEKEDNTFPLQRRGSYYLGGKKVHYALPDGMVDDDLVKDASKVDTTPEDDLVLDVAYGYNGKQARDNVFVNRDNTDEIVYCLAGTGIVLDTVNNEQRFFIGHNEDILCLAVHPNRPLCATAQLDPKGPGTPYICIWDINDMSLKKRIVHHDRGIACLGFSPDGQLLASIGNDDNHSIAIWDWENTKEVNEDGQECTPLITCSTAKDQIFQVKFNQYAATSTEDDEKKTVPSFEIVTVGPRHLKLWTLLNPLAKKKQDRSLRGRNPSTQSTTNIVQKAFHCVTFLADGSYIVGTHSGHIYRLLGQKLVTYFKAHEGIVGSVYANSNEDFYVSVGDDGLLKRWNNDDNSEVETINFGVGEEGRTQPRAMDINNGKAYIGQKNNTLRVVDMVSKENREILNGHYSEVWGLACHPNEPVFVTSAHDGTVKVFNYEEKRYIPEKSQSYAKEHIRSCTFTDDGKLLAVGFESGRVICYKFDDMSVVWDKKLCGENADALDFSPNNETLAVGSWDQFVYLVNASDGFVRKTLKGHTSSILMLNFSSDGTQLMSNSRDYEALYWDVKKGRLLNRMNDYADSAWHRWNCFLGWPVAGIWADCDDGTDINSVDRSKDEKYLCAGDDFGQVRLYKYPCTAKNAAYKGHPGHSSHVPNVRFSANDQYVMSVGGADCAVFQWRRVLKGAEEQATY